MTGETRDPFANPTPEEPRGGSTPLPPPPPPAPVNAPGVIPGAQTPQAPGTLSGVQNYPDAPPLGMGPRPEAPTKVAWWAIGLTGAVTLVTVANAFMAEGQVEMLKETLASDSTSPMVGSPLDVISFPLQIAAFVLLALWMWKIRQNLTQIGRTPGGPPAVEWWGWFVPLANAVLPFLGMRALTKSSVPMGTLLGWWLAYVAATITSTLASTAVFAGIDWQTGELGDPSALDGMVPYLWATGALMLVSWLFLVSIIRTTTARHLD